MCHDLGDMAVLNSDYSTVCYMYTREWYMYMIAGVCGVLVLMWPIGLPVLFFSMRRELPQIQAGDEDTLKFWDFALGDYDADHWYWELRQVRLLDSISSFHSVFSFPAADCFILGRSPWTARPWINRPSVLRGSDQLLLLLCVRI